MRRQNTGNHPDPLADLERDAARWRALMLCGKIKMQGSSGVDPHTGARNGNNVHFGAEFWPEPSSYPDLAEKEAAGTRWGIACLTALADVLLEQHPEVAQAPAPVPPRPYPGATEGTKVSEYHGFEGGSLSINTFGNGAADGRGWLCFEESDLEWETGEDGKDYRILNLANSELIFMRDTLNKIFPISDAEPDATPLYGLDEWLPIADVPMDGTRVDLKQDNTVCLGCYWGSYDREDMVMSALGWVMMRRDMKPTHYRLAVR